MVERLSDRSLSAALRHAQDGWEAVPPLGAEAVTFDAAGVDTLHACLRITWGAPVRVRDYLAAGPSRADRGELVYRFWRRGEPQPLYVGRTSGSMHGRLQAHRSYGAPTSANRAAFLRAVARRDASALISQALNPADPLELDRILLQVGRYAANLSFDAPCTMPGAGERGVVAPNPSLTAAVEKLYHALPKFYRSASQLNPRSQARFEDEVPQEDPGGSEPSEAALDRLADAALAETQFDAADGMPAEQDAGQGADGRDDAAVDEAPRDTLPASELRRFETELGYRYTSLPQAVAALRGDRTGELRAKPAAARTGPCVGAGSHWNIFVGGAFVGSVVSCRFADGRQRFRIARA
jgi:hypothetical protein